MALEKFHKTVKGGQVTLPHFKNLPFGLLRKYRKEDEGEQLFGILEEVADQKSLDLLDKLTVEEVAELTKEWQEASQVTLGESEAS